MLFTLKNPKPLAGLLRAITQRTGFMPGQRDILAPQSSFLVKTGLLGQEGGGCQGALLAPNHFCLQKSGTQASVRVAVSTPSPAAWTPEGQEAPPWGDHPQDQCPQTGREALRRGPAWPPGWENGCQESQGRPLRSVAKLSQQDQARTQVPQGKRDKSLSRV